jgi:hypothetical protein
MAKPVCAVAGNRHGLLCSQRWNSGFTCSLTRIQKENCEPKSLISFQGLSSLEDAGGMKAQQFGRGFSGYRRKQMPV